MKAKYFWLVAICLTAVFPVACNRGSSMVPASSGGGNGGGSTIMVSTASSTTSSTSYIYTSASGTNSTGGVLSLTAHVGDTIVLPGSTFHPLYFDHGTSTCIFMGSTSQQSYVFPSTGTYYFHCGNHGSGCSTGNGGCGSTNCSAMAGQVSVN
jgi:hypothetical protein